MKQLTYEEFCHQPLSMGMHLLAEDYGLLTHYNEALGIRRETYTPRNPKAVKEWGKAERTYYLDGDPREFTCVAELYVAWMHKVCGVKESRAAPETPESP